MKYNKSISYKNYVLAHRAGFLSKSLKVFLGSLLLALSSKITVPTFLVPTTMQLFVVALLSGLYGSRLALATLLTYFVEGIVGLPVFAYGGGLMYFTSPTTGYLLGYVLMAYVVGLIVDKNYVNDMKKIVIFLSIAVFLDYFLGVLWLSYFTGFIKAVEVGVFPFLFVDAIKIFLVATILKKVYSLKKS